MYPFQLQQHNFASFGTLCYHSQLYLHSKSCNTRSYSYSVSKTQQQSDLPLQGSSHLQVHYVLRTADTPVTSPYSDWPILPAEHSNPITHSIYQLMLAVSMLLNMVNQVSLYFFNCSCNKNLCRIRVFKVLTRCHGNSYWVTSYTGFQQSEI